MTNSNNLFSIDEKLQTMKPYIDLALFNSSIDYRRKVLCCFHEQENKLQALTEAYSNPSMHEEYDCILGYN